ncbi:hypothetical protein HYH03_010182 [Edaphochlamys debaryana]|uniref:EGF-like domain-containing protein n=1 Tax=Edaphochlamys debaryana TaxID=47281 RepID=A0A835XZP6_9CHLO|nr:hypothetical protein HYH03_010182 [Edaphochlamys debaryana]|eukprot:KAG2491391.1 hypothetical protein HYH03_010182 [Edaphochlamys debaryana]
MGGMSTAGRLRPQEGAAISNVSGRCRSGCYANGGICIEELGRCDCPKHRLGGDCERNASFADFAHLVQEPKVEQRYPYPCLNACNGKGSCTWGDCSCRPGYFGPDCSASLRPGTNRTWLLDGSYTPRAARPHVYVYDIPHNYSSWRNALRVDRPLQWVFWQRLLGSGALTADGDAADWYYIPVRLRSTTDGVRLAECIAYIRAHWPWFDRLQGHRHFIIHTGDMGRGEVMDEARALSENVTWLHHWGLTETWKEANWKAAHRPGKDIVVPVYMDARYGSGHIIHSGLHPRAPRLERTGTLLFSGRICGDKSQPDPAKPWPHCAARKGDHYSQGVRQMVHFYHHDRIGYRITTHNPSYAVDLLRYRWCLSPSGGGHGHRQALVAAMGCVPLVIADNVSQPFEPEMDWSAFALRLPQADIPVLHQRLAAVDPATLQRLQDALLCAAQHLIYSSSLGSFMQEDGSWDAFEFTLQILRMQQTYPDLEPQDYARMDEQFRTFVNCGEQDMATYGRKLREAHRRMYPAVPPFPDGTNVTWERLYEPAPNSTAPHSTSLPWLFGAYLRRTSADQPNKLQLCSTSNWDVMKARCGSSGYRHVSYWHAIPPGGSACNDHAADLATCPRTWQ